MLAFEVKRLNLLGCVDVDLVGSDLDKTRNRMEYVFIYGAWYNYCVGFKVVAMSTTEGEYVVMAKASKEIVRLQNFLSKLGKAWKNGMFYNDGQMAIHLKKYIYDVLLKDKTHVEVPFHIGSRRKGVLQQVLKIQDDQNPPDMLTKPTTLDKMEIWLTSLGYWNMYAKWKNECRISESAKSHLKFSIVCKMH